MQKRHQQAQDIAAAAANEAGKEGQTAAFRLALACALLTSPVKAERETGKLMVKSWKYSKSAGDSQCSKTLI